MRKVMVCVAVTALMAMAGTTAAAQAAPAAPAASARPVLFGPEVNLALRGGLHLGAGARVVYPGLGEMVSVEGLGAFASFDYFFPGWEINANATYKIPRVQSPIVPYVGTGLNLVGGAGSTVGLNVLAGARYPASRLDLFGEVKLELRTGWQLMVTAGSLF